MFFGILNRLKGFQNPKLYNKFTTSTQNTIRKFSNAESLPFKGKGNIEGKREIEITENITNGNIVKKSVTYITEYISNMSRTTKTVLTIYLSGAVINNIYNTYNVGVIALKDAREKKGYNSEHDLKVVSYACGTGSWNRFFSSLIWAPTIFSNMVPIVVIALNKPSAFNKEKG